MAVLKILVLNTGSSTIKYDVIDGASFAMLGGGKVEVSGGAYAQALEEVLRRLGEEGLLDGLGAVGHRVVHGGERFVAPVKIDGEVMEALRATAPLAPLHNPPAIATIEQALARFPELPHVAVFDTAFHHAIPARAYRYAIPKSLPYRRYGFHGTSHAYVAREAAALLGRPLERLKLITLHLGNGASAAAIDGGRSIDTSMGMTPLEGLVMGTRSGDLDPSVALAIDDADEVLNRRSGLLGLCGASDMREVLRRAESGDEDAELALDVYCYRVKKYVGAYHAILGGLDALVFTAGIGEHAAPVRARICDGLAHLGLVLDPARNASGERTISRETSPASILVIPTEEEGEIARATARCLAPTRP